MEEPKHKQRPLNNSYFSGYARVAMALCTSVLLIKLSTTLSLADLLLNKQFYFSLCFNFLLAIIIIELIHWLNILLDQYYTWQVNPIKRLVLQLLLGIVGVLYADYWLVRGVYVLLEMDFKNSGFISKIFPIIVSLVILLQIILFFKRPKKGNVAIEQKQEVNPKHSQEHLFNHPSVKLNNQVQNIQPKKYWDTIEAYIQSKKNIFILDEVISVCTGTDYGDICLKNGNCYNMHYKAEELRNNLDPSEWVEIRSGKFYALNCISGLIEVNGKKCILLKKDYDLNHNSKVISRRYYTQAVKKFKAFEAKKFHQLSSAKR